METHRRILNLKDVSGKSVELTLRGDFCNREGRELQDMLDSGIKNEENDDTRFAEIIRRSLFEQYPFKLKIKEELYGEEQRVKITVIKVEKVNPSVESRYLLDLIAKM